MRCLGRPRGMGAPAHVSAYIDVYLNASGASNEMKGSVMQSAVTKKPIQEFNEAKFVSANNGSHRTTELFELIAQRAFDIFQFRGQLHGHDLDDWLLAETELFHGVHLHLYEVDDSIVLEAETPGFRAEELEVTIEPRRVTITGKRSRNGKVARNAIHHDPCADRIFRVLGLSLKVDPKRATATLKDGILELTLPKASWTPEVKVETLSIVRAEDTRLWRESFAKAFSRHD